MQIYDYREETGYINTVSAKVDSLTERQAKQVSEFIDKVKDNTSQEQIAQSIKWFSFAILPILQSLGEITCSLLNVEKEDTPIIVVTLTNGEGIDFMQSNKYLQMIVNLSNHISINCKDGEVTLTLVFDCTDFI